MSLVVLALAGGASSLPALSQPVDVDASRAAPAEDQVASPVPTPDPLAPSDAVAQLKDWAVASGDPGGLPFIVIDKVAAAVFAFDASGGFVGAAPALLGIAHGDDSTPGIGSRKLSSMGPKERTTPAGRFAARIGPALGANRNVLWIDYHTSVALHSVIKGAKERRVERLKSVSADDNRITFGCINVPDDYYKYVVRPLFIRRSGIVYILPESKSLTEVFPAFTTAGPLAPPAG
jgi:hypothetical protein